MSSRYLRRYTDLTALILLLRERKLTLLDPSSWEDSNDSYYLDLYKEKRKLKSVLALCFTEADERFHYWRVFAPGASGVCIRLSRSILAAAVLKHSGLQMRSVDYRTLDQMRDRKLKTVELPFLKRIGFKPESEVRIIYESATKKLRNLDIAIPLPCVNKVTLSPWMPPSLSSDVKKVLQSICGCHHLKIVRSTLIGNEEWKSFGDDAE